MAPLSDGIKSAPSTPSRFNERRKQQFRTRSWGNRTTNTTVSCSSPPLATKSIMEINSSKSDSSGDNSSKLDSRLGLAFIKNKNAIEEDPSPIYEAPSPMYEAQSPSPSSSQSSPSSNQRRHLSPKTSPRKPSDSPGPQPRSPRIQYTYSQLKQQDQTFSRSLFEQTLKTPDHIQQQTSENDGSPRSRNNNFHAHYPTNSEAGSPTEIIENRWQPTTGAEESSQPSSHHYHSNPTDSEAGAPTEITKNHVSLNRSYLLRHPSGGKGGNQISLKDRRGNSSSDILSRVRSRFHNQAQQQHQNKQEGKDLMPSLLDSSSSCASSALPITAAQAEEASAVILAPSSRLSRHVENARKQSILSPEASEATSLPASFDNETFGSTSLTTEIGSFKSHRLGAKPLSSLTSAKTKTPAADAKTPLKQGGLLRRPVGARVTALESHYRNGKFTVRGARANKAEADEHQDIIHDEEEEEETFEDENFPDPILSASFPDPILSASYTMDDNSKHRYEQDEEQYCNEEEDIEFKDSDEDSSKKSYVSPDHEIYHDDYEESPLPEYINNRTTGGGKELSPVFIAYNNRQTPNTDGVFQFKKGRGKLEKNKGKKVSASNKAASEIKGRDKEGKSPIQPLFSSERLDENNTSSIHESSIRSKSAGRTMTSRQFMKVANEGEVNMKGLPRRSKSLSERSERKQRHDQEPKFSMELSEAMKTIVRDRKKRNQKKQYQEPPKMLVPGNIVVNNEKSNAQDGAEASRTDSSLTQSSIPPPPSQSTRPLSTNRFLPSPGEAHAKAPRNEEVLRKETSASIKDKIRAFNLKKSPRSYSSTWKFENSRGGTNTLGRTDEEKKEDWNAVQRFNEEKDSTSPNMKRGKLDRKSLWARYYDESANNYDEDESHSSTNDDFSVSSLLEQLEQKISKTQIDVSGEDEEDDDDRSVKSLRDMFEPATKKKTGETINNLKARFEPKPKAPRLSFTKQARLQRKRSKRIGESNQKAEGYGESFLKGPVRSDLDSAESESDGKKESEKVAEEKPKSLERWKLEEKDLPEGNNNEDFITAPVSKNAHGRLNDWSTQREVGNTSMRRIPAVQGPNSNHSNLSKGRTLPHDAQDQRANTGVGKGNKYIPSQNRVFGLIETRKAPLKDNNRKVPGSHWVSQDYSSDSEHQIQKKGTKESSSDSEYSEAVTLDPSFADVSNLSNPSALHSPESEQEQSEGSSVLFEHLETNPSYGELGTPNSELAIPELKESRRQVNNTRVLSGSSVRKYRNINSQKIIAQNSGSAEMENSHTGMKGESPRVITPDNGHNSGSRAHFFNRVDNVDPSDDGYGASGVPNDVHSGTQGVVSPMQGLHPPAHTPSPGLKALNGSSRAMLPSVNQSGRAKDFSRRNSEASYPSTENSHQGVDSFNRSNRSSETSPSYRSSRSTENPNMYYDASNRSRGLQESARELTQSIVIPHREGDLSNRSTRSPVAQRSGISNVQDNSHLSYRQKPNTLDSVIRDDYGPSWDESRDQNSLHRHNLLAGTSQPSSKQIVVPPMPSPFDENYAAIMESRHKMLLERQRALLNRRANREKSQKYQQGFFGRTNPGTSDESTSLLNRSQRGPRLSDEFQDGREPKSPEIRMTRNPSNPSSGWETPPTPQEGRHFRSSGTNQYGSRRAKEMKEAGVPRSPVASILSRIRPTFSAISRRDNGTSQKQAVIDRISAVRAARLRRNYAYGKIIQSSNNYGVKESNRQEKALPRKLETIQHNVPGYRFYPHNESDDFRTRGEDESLSTFESNPQEYAAEFSLD